MKRLKLGEQRKIPGVYITKVCANLSTHWKFAIIVGWGIFVRTCILWELSMWGATKEK